MKPFLTVLCLFTLSYVNSQHLIIEGKAKIDEMDTINQSALTVVRQSNGILAVRQYTIGDTLYDGIVFWVDETGEHGLIASISDQSNSVEWGTLGNQTSALRDNVYSGMMNTERIIISQGTNNYAANLCAQYSGGGYGDWYLPSKQELNLIYEKLHRNGCQINVETECETAIGNFANSVYWSSTAEESFDFDTAWSQDFSNGLQSNTTTKNTSARIRAIRAF